MTNRRPRKNPTSVRRSSRASCTARPEGADTDATTGKPATMAFCTISKPPRPLKCSAAREWPWRFRDCAKGHRGWFAGCRIGVRALGPGCAAGARIASNAGRILTRTAICHLLRRRAYIWIKKATRVMTSIEVHASHQPTVKRPEKELARTDGERLEPGVR